MAAGLKSAAPKTFKGRRSRLSRWIHDGPPCLWPLLLSLLLATCSSQADNLGESLLFLFFNGYCRDLGDRNGGLLLADNEAARRVSISVWRAALNPFYAILFCPDQSGRKSLLKSRNLDAAQ